MHQGIRVAIAAETKRRGPHLVTNFKRYLTHLLTPVLEPMGLQMQISVSETVNAAKTIEEYGDDSKEQESLLSLRELDQSLRQVLEVILHCLTHRLAGIDYYIQLIHWRALSLFDSHSIPRIGPQGIRFVLGAQKPQPGANHVDSVSTSLTKLLSPLLADLTQREQIRLVLTQRRDRE